MEVFGDNVSLTMMKLHLDHRALFQKEYKRPALRIRKRIAEAVGEGMSGREAIELLESHMPVVEKEIAQQLRGHSAYFWMSLLRRIAPKPIEGHDPANTFLARSIAELAIHKHSEPDPEGQRFEAEFEMVNGQAAPRDLSVLDVLAAYQVEYLAYEMWTLTASARTVWKGGRLRKRGTAYWTEVDDDLGQLIDSVDRRRESMPILAQAGSAGTFDDFWTTNERATVLPFLNVGQAEYDFAGLIGRQSTESTFVPNYLPAPFSTALIQEALEPFDEWLVPRYGASAGQLSRLLDALWLRILLSWEDHPHKIYGFIQRGYWISGLEIDDLKVDLAEALDVSRGDADLPHTDLQDISTAIDALVLTDDLRKSISLWDRSPNRPIWRAGSSTVVDMARMLDFLNEVSTVLGGLDGDAGGVKGGAFERAVLGRLKGVRGVQAWEVGRRLRAAGRVREIDIGLVQGDALVVIECKAMVHNQLMVRGEINTLTRRWARLVKHLNQAERTAHFLLENPEGDNYNVPSGVRRVIPLVCTAYAEYIPTRHAGYWATDETPIICTPPELESLLRELPETPAMECWRVGRGQMG